jgi:hypothetical protein
MLSPFNIKNIPRIKTQKTALRQSICYGQYVYLFVHLQTLANRTSTGHHQVNTPVRPVDDIRSPIAIFSLSSKNGRVVWCKETQSLSIALRVIIN